MTDGELVFIGSYTAEADGRGEGIYVSRRDPRTGELSAPRLAAATPSPSFLARHPRLPVLYAAGELADGQVTAWAIAADGDLTLLGEQPTGGDHPCHLAVTADGGHLVTANYGSGSVSVHPLDLLGVPGERTDLRQHTGSGPVADRQEGPHAHMATPDPDGDRVWVIDLGLDSLFGYRLDPATGRLEAPAEPFRTRPGTGPRHLARADGRLYVTGELDGSITGYAADADGTLTELGRSKITDSGGPVHASEIGVGASGHFAYVANRGPDTIAVFALNSDTGAPEFTGEVSSGGEWPRHFALMPSVDPEGPEFLYVANERSDSVITFRLDPETGIPAPGGPVLEVGTPTCILRA
ncbi:lactonase family protein [Catenuloplanes sp. NPDC051500]|uniref:lactonase family protein n=1 Tax=Catenuloplanes sp. NPDC051500 TaxID=3363959 RepID=UPI00379C5366